MSDETNDEAVEQEGTQLSADQLEEASGGADSDYFQPADPNQLEEPLEGHILPFQQELNKDPIQQGNEPDLGDKVIAPPD